MRYVFCLALAAVSAMPAAAQAEAQVAAQDTLLQAYPEDGSLVIWGCAARQSTRAREIELALEDAAWKAALFFGIEVSNELVINENKSFWSFTSSEQTKIIPRRGEDFSQYKKDLRYNENEIRVIDNSVFLRCVYPAQINIDIEPSATGKKPDWIKNIPQNLSNAALLRGFAKRHISVKDTIAAAYQNAVISFAAQKNSIIETQTFVDSQGIHSTETT